MRVEVWICDFFGQAGSREDLHAWITGDWGDRSMDFWADLSRRHSSGLPLDARDLPARMIGNYSDQKVGKPPHMFSGNGYLMVTEQCANVLRQFDLGQGELFPIEILENDWVTPVEGSFFIFNVGNQKRTVVPEESRNVKKMRGNTKWTPKFGLHDDEDIAILESSIDGPDIWIDPEFQASIFFNDRLFDALQSGHMFGELDVRRCRILES